MNTPLPQGGLPSITLTQSVYDHLSALSTAMAGCQPDVAEYLERELDRARVVADDALPTATITIGSRVRFLNCETNQRYSVTLVWPSEEDSANHRLSVMTPVGAALVGLSAGQSIAWQSRTGVWRYLRVEEVGAGEAEPALPAM
jgi:regulator of nucleoside diphosphate kinase